jgi:predicted O-methyltransferase YrrM
MVRYLFRRVFLLPLVAALGAALAGLATAVALVSWGTGAALVLVAALLGAGLAAAAVAGWDTYRRRSTVDRKLATLPSNDQVTGLVRSHATDLHKRVRGDVRALGAAVRDDSRQLEALLNLHAMVPVRHRLPASRGWAASPDLLLAYVGEILTRRPGLIVECGSGVSTVWAALALRTLGGSGRVVALEHDAAFRESTLAALAEHGLGDLAEVRLAPIDTVAVDGQDRPWYTASALDGLDGIEVLFVDGPIGSLAPESRYPAVPLLRDRFAPGAVILLDDADRPEEQQVLAHWLADWPQLDSQQLPLEKGAARIVVPEAVPARNGGPDELGQPGAGGERGEGGTVRLEEATLVASGQSPTDQQQAEEAGSGDR